MGGAMEVLRARTKKGLEEKTREWARTMKDIGLEEWGSSVVVEHETIRSVVNAYAEGRIELEPPHPTAAKAPSLQL